MAVQMQTPALQVNHIGKLSPDEDQVHPALQPDGSRSEYNKVPVWHPITKVKEMHYQFNARDMVRLDGWLEYDPTAPPKKVAPTKEQSGVNTIAGSYEKPADVETDETDASTDTDGAPDPGDTISVDDLPPAMRTLTILREQLQAAGTLPDMRWGVRRLTEELTARGIDPKAT